MGFLDLFRFKKSKEKRVDNVLFFHEDDFCQIELIPSENVDEAKSQAQRITDFAADHFDGIGYKDMYVRSENKFALSSRKIPVQELHDLLKSPWFSEATKVTTGYGQDYRLVPQYTVGFGHECSAIYYDFVLNDVTNIWLTQPFNIEKKKLIPFLLEVGKRWGLLLVDWEASTVVDLSNEKAIIQYISGK